MTTTVFDLVLNNIADQREGIARALVDGSAKDYAEYKSMCGEVRGLSVAHALINDLRKKLEQDDDE